MNAPNIIIRGTARWSGTLPADVQDAYLDSGAKNYGLGIPPKPNRSPPKFRTYAELDAKSRRHVRERWRRGDDPEAISSDFALDVAELRTAAKRWKRKGGGRC